MSGDVKKWNTEIFKTAQIKVWNIDFYRAMHFSAKRGIAIACHLSVCLSVCLWRWW